MFREIEIEGFKSIERLKLPLGRVTVLIGEDGCGKSNILEAIAFASAACEMRLDHEFLASRGIRSTEPRLMRPAFGVSRAEYMRVTLWPGKGEPFGFTFAEDQSSVVPRWFSLPIPQRSEVEGREEASPPLVVIDEPELLLSQPMNSLLKHVATVRDQTEKEIFEAVIRGLFRRSLANTPLTLEGYLVFSPENSALRIFQREGQILPIGINGEGLFAHLRALDRAGNIDASLNPRLCARLMHDVVELAKEQDRQVVVTTHNPAVLDGLDLTDDEQRLMVVSRKPSGSTRVRRVEAPKPVEGAPPLRLSEAFIRGYLGGLPGNF